MKQFTQDTTPGSQQAFDQELAVLKSLRSSCHDHILGYWATFEQSGRQSIIFPLAEGNLREFWANTILSSVKSPWCLQQMAGIADGLSYLHDFPLALDSRYMSVCHMDMKPENVLIFTDASSAHTLWKISDFGASYLRPKDSKQELPPHPGLGTYEPPECQLDIRPSQAYDLWSLGCIFLECAAWLMNGSGAIDDFAEDRLNDLEVSGNKFKDDYFFTLEFDESYMPVRAMTRPAVIKWIRALKSDPKCSEAISELLHLIESGLLQVDQSKRLTASYLSQRLEVIYRAAQRGFDYGTQSIPQTPKAQVVEVEDCGISVDSTKNS